MNKATREQWELLYNESYYWKHGMGCWTIKEPYSGKQDMHFFYVLPPAGSKPIQESNLSLVVNLGFQIVTITDGQVKYSENTTKARHDIPRQKVRPAIITSIKEPINTQMELIKPIKPKHRYNLMELFKGVITQTARNLMSRRNIKEDVIWHYSFGSMRCAACGFNDIRSLSIDHINGGGRKHLKEIKGSLYAWLKRNNYPLGFQVLCMNCQFIKRQQYHECNRKPINTISNNQQRLDI
jgi:hypothetical protein